MPKQYVYVKTTFQEEKTANAQTLPCDQRSKWELVVRAMSTFCVLRTSGSSHYANYKNMELPLVGLPKNVGILAV